MKNSIVYIKDTEHNVFYLVKGNEWTAEKSRAGIFTNRGAVRLHTIHARDCLGAPNPNGDYEVYSIGARRIDNI